MKININGNIFELNRIEYITPIETQIEERNTIYTKFAFKIILIGNSTITIYSKLFKRNGLSNKLHKQKELYIEFAEKRDNLIKEWSSEQYIKNVEFDSIDIN